jgi:hypothetical protein
MVCVSLLALDVQTKPFVWTVRVANMVLMQLVDASMATLGTAAPLYCLRHGTAGARRRERST